MKVREILMTKRPGVLTIPPDQTVMEAVQFLAEKRIGAVIISDDGKYPLGILSERDIVREVARHGADIFTARVEKIMTRNLVVATPDDEIPYLTNMMTERRFRHMPVMEDEELIGMVSIGDVVKAQLVHYEGEIHTLQHHIEGT